MEHGGGMTWLPPTYDPDINLVYLGKGNPNPAMAGQSRRGDNLWTASIVAVNADTGKLVWHYQTTPHDTHDWDAAQTPVLIDGDFEGRPRKLLAQANRNGLFFLLDRTNGQHLLTAPLVESANWYSRSEEHTSELQSLTNLVCRLLLAKKTALLRPRKKPRTYRARPRRQAN